MYNNLFPLQSYSIKNTFINTIENNVIQKKRSKSMDSLIEVLYTTEEKIITDNNNKKKIKNRQINNNDNDDFDKIINEQNIFNQQNINSCKLQYDLKEILENQLLTDKDIIIKYYSKYIITNVNNIIYPIITNWLYNIDELYNKNLKYINKNISKKRVKIYNLNITINNINKQIIIFNQILIKLINIWINDNYNDLISKKISFSKIKLYLKEKASNLKLHENIFNEYKEINIKYEDIILEKIN